MEKSYLKHVLSLLDTDEIHGIDFEQAAKDVFRELKTGTHAPSLDHVRADIDAIIGAALMKRLTRGYDVTPNATIFAHAAAHSRLEDLALLSCIVSVPDVDPQLFVLLAQPHFAAAALKAMIHPLLYSAACQCRTFITKDGGQTMSFPDALRDDCLRILEEYQRPHPPLVSPTVLCHYLQSIYPSSKDSWKNQDSEMIPYRYQQEILRLLPRRGIPCSRDASKQLQAFYKDTLFHEFDHRCPICGIDLPHMLIGSHIKPFRDCAHLYEPIDNNNGMLLCRNHDYLFDQGYISFNAKGTLLICKELKTHKNYREVFCLPREFHLEKRLLSEERKLFFAYHREHIFHK